MSLEDHEHVERVLAGEVDFFEPLVTKYNKMGGAIAFAVLGDFQQAEDAVQEAFLQAFRSLGSLREPSKFKSWFAGIVRRKALDMRRGRGNQLATYDVKTLSELPTADLPGVRSAAGKTAERKHLEREAHELVLRKIRELPEGERLVLVLKHMDGLSYSEIATVTKSSRSAVESRLFRARRALRAKLQAAQAAEDRTEN